MRLQSFRATFQRLQTRFPLLPCGCASFRCPPPQRRALRRRGVPFSPESDRGRRGGRGGGKSVKCVGRAPSMRRRIGAVLCALGSFPVVSKFNCIPSTSPSLSRSRSVSLSLSLSLSPSLSLSLLCTLHSHWLRAYKIFTVRLRAALFVQ